MRQLLLLLVAMLVASPLVAQQDQSVTITSEGRERRFILHLPSAPPAAGLPVALAYHGLGGTAESMRALSGFNVLADRHGFIVAYPHALDIAGSRQWNVYVDAAPGHAGANAPGAPDDVLFTRDIIAYLSDRYAVDRTRVYATGMSNGGFMSYALSLLAADAIAAIAPVAGNLWGDSPTITQLAGSSAVRTMPVMHVHGTADNVVRYVDIDNTPQQYGEYPLFVPGRACGATTYTQVVPIAPNVDRLVFCSSPVPVWLIRITGMGHVWTDGAFATSREIVKFFGLDAGAAIADDAVTAAASVRASGASIVVRPVASVRVDVVTSAGALVSSAVFDAEVEQVVASNLASGLYIVRATSVSGSSYSCPVVVVR